MIYGGFASRATGHYNGKRVVDVKTNCIGLRMLLRRGVNWAINMGCAAWQTARIRAPRACVCATRIECSVS